MKYLTDRQEIARAMNFDKFPVLTVNREDLYDKDNPEFSFGCRVRVAWDSKEPEYEGMTTHGKLYYYNGKLKISGEGGCLQDSFGYHDVMHMVQEAHAPIVHAGQVVVVVESWPSKKICTVRMMKVGSHVDRFCQVVTTLEDLEEDFPV